jgi:hypothetical protein
MEDKKTKIQNPHDKFFKETFSNPVVARDFVENYLPERVLNMVDLNELEIQDSSHVDEELRDTRGRFFCVHEEHKGTVLLCTTTEQAQI